MLRSACGRTWQACRGCPLQRLFTEFRCSNICTRRQLFHGSFKASCLHAVRGRCACVIFGPQLSYQNEMASSILPRGPSTELLMTLGFYMGTCAEGTARRRWSATANVLLTIALLYYASTIISGTPKPTTPFRGALTACRWRINFGGRFLCKCLRVGIEDSVSASTGHGGRCECQHPSHHHSVASVRRRHISRPRKLAWFHIFSTSEES